MKGTNIRTNISKQDSFLQFIFGLLPCLLSWGLIFIFVYLSFTQPLSACAMVIAFALYWVLRVVYLVIFLKKTHKRILVDEMHANWRSRGQGLDNVDEYLRGLYYGSVPEKNTTEDVSLSLHKADIRQLRQFKTAPVKYKSIYHCLIIAVKEFNRDAFEACFTSLLAGSFPLDRVMVLLAVEDNLVAEVRSYISGIEQAREKKFYALKVVGVSRGRGTGETTMAHLINQAAGLASLFFQKNRISQDSVVVSYLSEPRVIDEEYLSALTYFYLVHPRRTCVAFQALPVFSENILRSNSLLAGYEIGSTFLEMLDMPAPAYLRRFYINSMSLGLLTRLTFLPEDVASYSQAFSLMAYAKYGDSFEVITLPVRFTAEVLSSGTKSKSMAAVKQRSYQSAQAVEGIAYAMRFLLKNKDIPVRLKIGCLIQFLESAVINSLWPFVLGFSAWLPLFLVSKEFSHTMFYFSFQTIAATIIILSLTGFVAALAAAGQLLLKPKGDSKQLLGAGNFISLVLGAVAGFFSRAWINLCVQLAYASGKYFSHKE